MMNTVDVFLVNVVVIFCQFFHPSTADLKTIPVEQYRAWSPISADSDSKNVTMSIDSNENLTEKPTLIEFVKSTLQTTARLNEKLESTDHIAMNDGFPKERKLRFSGGRKKKSLKKKSLKKKSKHINLDEINVAHGEKVLSVKKKSLKIARKGNISTQEDVTAKDMHNKKLVDRERYTTKTLDEINRTNSRNVYTEDNKYDLYYLSPLHISNQLRYISEKFPAENVTIEQEMLGKTHQHKDIIMLKVTEKVQQTNNMRFHVEENIYGYTSKPLPEKKIIFIVHGLSVMNIRSVPCLAVSEFFEDLINIYFDQLAEFDIFLIPMANPDGVAQKKSYWNKNKSPQKTCPGVALDRNFDISWHTRRNMSSCSQQYPGPDAFSEPETRAIRSIFQRYGHRIAAFLNLHAGSSSAKILKGNAILYPKGYELQSLDQQYGHLKSEVLEAVHLYTEGVRDPHIVVDTMNKWHGKVAGTSVDYAAVVYETPISLELVMRPYKQNKEPLMDEAFTHIWTPALKAIFEFIERNSKLKN